MFLEHLRDISRDSQKCYYKHLLKNKNPILKFNFCYHRMKCHFYLATVVMNNELFHWSVQMLWHLSHCSPSDLHEFQISAMLWLKENKLISGLIRFHVKLLSPSLSCTLQIMKSRKRTNILFIFNHQAMWTFHYQTIENMISLVYSIVTNYKKQIKQYNMSIVMTLRPLKTKK